VTLEQVWECLCRVTALTFVARSATPKGWNGQGSGSVTLGREGPGVITFTEADSWQPEGGRPLRFSNIFRWSIIDSTGQLRLEHLRFGVEHPVFLFDLAASPDGAWESVSPHLCHEDCYSARMSVQSDHLALRWAVDGPSKQEMIDYTYSWNKT
jgi:hypothetical protein